MVSLFDKLNTNQLLNEISKYKDSYFYTCVFNTADEKLKKFISQNADITMCSSMVSSKVLIDKVTKANQDSIYLAENKLYNICLCDYEHDISKLISRL